MSQHHTSALVQGHAQIQAHADHRGGWQAIVYVVVCDMLNQQNQEQFEVCQTLSLPCTGIGGWKQDYIMDIHGDIS